MQHIVLIQYDSSAALSQLSNQNNLSVTQHGRQIP